MKSIGHVKSVVTELVVLAENDYGDDMLSTSVYVIGDKNSQIQELKLTIKKIDGIDEEISHVASHGFAVGIDTNKVYRWQSHYQTLDLND